MNLNVFNYFLRHGNSVKETWRYIFTVSTRRRFNVDSTPGDMESTLKRRLVLTWFVVDVESTLKRRRALTGFVVVHPIVLCLKNYCNEDVMFRGFFFKTFYTLSKLPMNSVGEVKFNFRYKMYLNFYAIERLLTLTWYLDLLFTDHDSQDVVL